MVFRFRKSSQASASTKPSKYDIHPAEPSWAEHYERQLADAGQTLAREPTHIIALRRKATALLRLGRYEEAAAVYEIIISQRPEDKDVWGVMGGIFSCLKRYQESIAAFERAIALNFVGTSGQQNLYATALIRCGRIQDGINVCERVLESEPGSTSAWINLGFALLRCGDCAKALAAMNQALMLQPHNIAALINKAVILRKLKRYDEALQVNSDVLTIAPRKALALANKAATLGLLGHIDEALALADQALSLDPSVTCAWLNKGYALVCLKRYDEALAVLEQVRVLNTEGVCTAASWTYTGLALTALRRYDDALDAFKRATALDPNDAEAWAGFGELLIELGSHEQALTVLNHALALDIDPKEASTWQSKARALRGLGRDDEAAQAEREAATLAHQRYDG